MRLLFDFAPLPSEADELAQYEAEYAAASEELIVVYEKKLACEAERFQEVQEALEKSLFEMDLK